MYRGIEFFTATCLNWQHLLEQETHKEIVLNSLKFLVHDKRIWLYGYVLMPNHVHILWRLQDAWQHKSVEQHFLKFTAQQIKFNLIKHLPLQLERYKSTQSDRQYHFWERRPYVATMYTKEILEQKLRYIHQNPVKAKLCEYPEDYMYSSAAYYVNGQHTDSFLTHYLEHI